jgi:hypothetical protein
MKLLIITFISLCSPNYVQALGGAAPMAKSEYRQIVIGMLVFWGIWIFINGLQAIRQKRLLPGTGKYDVANGYKAVFWGWLHCLIGGVMIVTAVIVLVL